MRKSEKPYFVDNLSQELKSATGIVLIDYQGLTVKKQQDLKKRLKAVDAKMLVAKNTLFKLAAISAQAPEEILSDTVLSGPTAIILANKDSISTLQVLHKFAVENELPQMKVGIVGGSFQDKETLITLAKLPAKDILLAQVVGAIASPLYGLVGTLQGNLQKLVYILEEYKGKRVKG